MKPVIVIATHQRVAITSRNLRTLKDYQVVLVVSSVEEVRAFGPRCNVQLADNKPLGMKWQKGVDAARLLDPSHIIITGSDDILSRTYIEEAIKYKTQFVGVQSWYVTDQKRLYHFDYTANQPLGGGRCYSREFLEKINFNLFDPTRDKMLDDFGWYQVKMQGTSIGIMQGPEILAVKGNWPTINPLTAHFKSPNAILQATYEQKMAREIMMKKFNYEPW